MTTSLKSLNDLRDRVDVLRMERSSTKVRLADEKKMLEKTEASLGEVTEALQLVTTVSQSLQNRAHQGISRIVSMCLQAVFDDPYEFRVEFQTKRGRTEALLVFSRNGKDFRDPKGEIGGGVLDVASLALRVACIVMAKPPARRLLVLDEPFRNVRGKQNKARLREMLEMLADELQFQFILNIDSDAYPEFMLGKVVEMGQ